LRIFIRVGNAETVEHNKNKVENSVQFDSFKKSF